MSLTSPGASPLDIGVIIPAAGRGERAGSGDLKQFRPIAGIPMLLRSLRPFASHPRVRQIAVALPADVVSAPPDWLAQLAGDRVVLVPGGATRSESVLAGLGALVPGIGIVLVHDAARPFVATETINAVVEKATLGICAVAAVALIDTLKRAVPDGKRVFETVPRGGLWRAQTPQGFPRKALEEAYRAWTTSRAGLEATDDAALLEAAGFPVELVPDRSTNLKVTTPDDFWLAEALARR